MSDRLASFQPFEPGQKSAPAAHFNALRDVAQRVQRYSSINPGEPQALVKLKADIAKDATGAVVQVVYSGGAWVEVGRQFDARNAGPVDAGEDALVALSFAEEKEPFFQWFGEEGGTGGGGGAVTSIISDTQFLASDTECQTAGTTILSVTAAATGEWLVAARVELYDIQVLTTLNASIAILDHTDNQLAIFYVASHEADAVNGSYIGFAFAFPMIHLAASASYKIKVANLNMFGSTLYARATTTYLTAHGYNY